MLKRTLRVGTDRKPLYTVFATTFKVLRSVRGYRQSALAARVAVSKQTICRIEAGLLLPDPAMRSLLSKALGFPEDYLERAARLSLIHNAAKESPIAAGHLLEALGDGNPRFRLAADDVLAKELGISEQDEVEDLRHVGGESLQPN